MPITIEPYQSGHYSRPRQRELPFLNDIERESLTAQLKGIGRSTLEVVGDTLDIPGGFVRNTMARGAGLRLPDEGNIRGRDFLEQMGLIGPNIRKGWIPDMGDMAGFAFEVATDPLTPLMLGAGALSKTGKVFKAAFGKLPRSLVNLETGSVIAGKRALRLSSPRDVMRATMKNASGAERRAFRRKFKASAATRGFTGREAVNMFRNKPLAGSFNYPGLGTVTLPGAMGRASVFDKLGAAARYSGPGRAFAAKVNKPSMGLPGIGGQTSLGPDTFEGIQIAKSRGTQELFERTHILEGGGWNMKDPKEANEAFNLFLEGKELGVIHSLRHPGNPKMKAIDDAVVDIGKAFEALKERAIRDGNEAPALDDIISDLTTGEVKQVIGYQARVAALPEPETFNGPFWKFLGSRKKAQERKLARWVQVREDKNFLARTRFGLMRGTLGMMEAIADPQLARGSKLKPADRVALLGKKHMGWHDTEEALRTSLNQRTDITDPIELTMKDDLNQKWTQIVTMAGKINKFSPGANPWAGDPFTNAMKREFGAAELHVSTQNSYKHMGMTIKIGNEGTKLTTALQRIQLTGDNAIPQAIRSIAGWGDELAKADVAKLFSSRGKNIDINNLDAVEKGIADLFSEAKAGDKLLGKTDLVDGLKAEINQFRVPDQVMQDMTRLKDIWNTPAEIKPIMEAFDSFTDAFKAGVTTLFPGFHARNAYSEFWNNIVAEGYDPRYGKHNPLAYIVPYKDSLAIFHGKSIKDLNKIQSLKGLDDTAATRKVAEWSVSENVVGRGEFGEFHGARPGSAVEGELAIPGQVPRTATSAIGKAFKESERWPLSVRRQLGDVGEAPAEQTAVAMGRAVGGQIEDVARMATFIAKLRQGYSKEAAAMASKLAHVDYSRLTQFEKTVMRRVMPFYSWTRHQMPWQFQQLVQKPGGPTAQAIRGAGVSRGEEYVPGYASTGMSVELDRDPETGERTVLGGIDLPHESLLDMFKLGPNLDQAIAGTTAKFMSNLHPVKALGEFALDRPFFRPDTKLSQAYPLIGGLASNIGDVLGLDIDSNVIKDRLPGGRFIEAMAAASSGSRAFREASKLTDTRKSKLARAARFLTGARISTVKADAEQRAILEMQEARLRGKGGVGEYSSFYPRDLSAMSAETLLNMRGLLTVGAELRK